MCVCVCVCLSKTLRIQTILNDGPPTGSPCLWVLRLTAIPFENIQIIFEINVLYDSGGCHGMATAGPSSVTTHSMPATTLFFSESYWKWFSAISRPHSWQTKHENSETIVQKVSWWWRNGDEWMEWWRRRRKKHQTLTVDQLMCVSGISFTRKVFPPSNNENGQLPFGQMIRRWDIANKFCGPNKNFYLAIEPLCVKTPKTWDTRTVMGDL